MTTRNLFNSALFVLTLSLTACTTGAEEETTTAVNTTDSFKASPVDQYISASADSAIKVASQPVGQAIQQNANGINLPTLNPAHGQPGHDCAVEVGAPLKSSGAAKNNVTTTQPATMPTINAQPAAKTAAGLNPPHGEPGHRCEIAVGAPLNSSPTSAAPVPAPFNNSPAQLPNANTGNAKLNPAHGQPGHDCAVPVGQPLKG
jgi:hypothetical protein